jgi:hypothetical protein
VIVISGALVLVALVLLVLGLTRTDLDFVYGSIGVSLVSFVFLVIGILQRRGESSSSDAPQVTQGGDPSEQEPDKDKDAATAGSGRPAPQFVPAASSAKAGTTGSVPVVDEDLDDDDEELEPGGGPVLVVPGRPRYHVEGCRYLSGRSPEEIDVLDAQDDGFTPCGVCKPDEALEALYGEPYEDEELEPLEDEEPEDDPVDTGVPDAEDDVPVPVPAGRGRSGSSKIVSTPAPTPTKARTPAKAPKPAKAARSSTAAGPSGAAVTPAKAASATSRGKVVVIPDRGRFHTPSCRFVRDTLGTEELTRAQAGKQGFQACGVCKP